MAAVLSLALNAGALRALEAAGAFGLPRSPDARVVLSVLAADRWEANRRVAGEPSADMADEPPRPAPAAPVPPPAPEPPQGTSVRVAPSPDSRRPERARFLADRDNTVPRDVQRRGPDVRDSETVLARPTPGSGEAQGIPVPGEGGNAEASSPGAPSATAADAGGGVLERDEPRNAAPGEERPARLDGTVADARLALATLGGPRSASAGAVKDGEGGARRSGRYDPRLLPTAATFAQLSGGSPTAQSLPGVAEGDTTSLNTRRFRFADFYARVSDAVRREWDPNRAWDAKDPYSSRYGRTLRAATVDIVLTTDGAVREVRVVNSSGFAFYDRELVRAIAAAAPFPNPPAALANADGLIVLDYTFALRWKPGFLPRALSGVGAVAAPSASAAVPGSR